MIVKEESGLKIQIDQNNNKAKAKVVSNSNDNIFIPRFIKKDSKVYPIVSLCGPLKNIRQSKVSSVNFSEDSEVQIIGQNAFASTEITKLFIPASVKELKEGWCSFTDKLNKVIISPNNSYFSNFNKDIIIGKSTLESESFDSLYFASRNIFQITIPSFIKRVAPYAFSDCKYLKFVDLPEDSSLEIIGNSSFSGSKIFSITIPKHVKIIGKKAFEYCTNLSKIKISEDSELESIGSQAFAKTLIDHLYFPAKLKELQSGWFKSMKKLHSISISPKNRFFTIIEGNLIVGKSNPEIDDYDILYLVLPGSTSLTLPSNIKKIDDYAFIKTRKLKSIKIPDDSKLEIIGKFAFYKSKITQIDIPKSVTIIDECAFDGSSLEVINFTDDSNLKVIGEYAFSDTSITSIKIPKHVTEIKKNAFFYCTRLKEILFCDDAEIENIGQFAFKRTSITKMKIPKNVKIVKRGTFTECRKLEAVTFMEPSETTRIAKAAFSGSSINRITFPSSLCQVDHGWNKNANKLNKIEVPNDNNHFKIIENEILISNSLSVKSKKHDSDSDEEEYDDDDHDKIVYNYDDYIKHEEKAFDVICFVPRNVKEVRIPEYIKHIDSYTFSGCKQLTAISINKESSLETLCKESFSSTSISSIIIPKHVKIIGNKCFKYCNELKSVEFADDSQLEVICTKAFPTIPIENISIPNSVKIIEKDAFKPKDSYEKSVTELSSISENSQLQCINECLVNLRSLKTFKIPNHVKVIKSNAFKYCCDLEKVDISEESELTTIESRAFYDCSIKSIYIPPLLTNISDFLTDLSKLTTITVSPQNKLYRTVNNGKIILGKSDINSDNYDVLLYSTRDIKKIIIRSYIKKINSFAFKKCQKLKNVEFEENSQLEIIDQKSFKSSSIDDIKIPDSVKIIGECAFSKCKYLRRIKISENSKLNYIGKKAFYCTDLEQISIPKYVEVIDEGAFMKSSLETIRFTNDSLLNKIGSCAFYQCKIYSITVPNHVKEIEERTFASCNDFRHLKFDEESELQVIHKEAFFGSTITNLKIPSKLKKLETGWAENVGKLETIKVSQNNEYFTIIDKTMIVEKSNPNNDQFDVLTFVSRDAKDVTIPSSIKTIRKDSFSYCKRLKEIKFAENSQLEIIENRAFYKASCECRSILMPKSVKFIGDYSFAHSVFTSVEFPEDSLLQQIGSDAFYDSYIKKFVFPNKIKCVTFNIFERCSGLEEIQMSDNVEFIDPCIDYKLYIKTINIPEKIDDFKVIYSLPNLTNIFISPKNKYFQNYEGKLIVKKNDSNDYNIYYALPNVGDITIPSYFTKIDSSIFSYNKIGKVSFNEDSLLKIIKNSAFERSTITEICIPKHVKVIGSKSFSDCSNLTKVEFAKDSELKIIMSGSFEGAPLTTIDIPKSVTTIDSNAFSYSKLQVINFADDSKLKFIGYNAFKRTSITKMKIPKNVKIINGGTFADCQELEEVTFMEPSETTRIAKAAFSGSSINRITFPSSLCQVDRGWNKDTNKLNKIEVPNDNNHFKIIENEILISNSLSYYDERRYYMVRKSSDDDVDYEESDESSSSESYSDSFEEEENKKQEGKAFDVICFIPRNVKEVRIPEYIKRIDAYAFSGCKKLKEISINKESSLETLCKESFSSTSISSIIIPKHVKIIGDECFNYCDKLKNVEIVGDQNISIYRGAFATTGLKGFSFPKGVVSYDTNIFEHCESLCSIEFLCDGKFELSENHLINQVLLIAFPNAQSIIIDKPGYGKNENEVIIFTIPFAKIEYID